MKKIKIPPKLVFFVLVVVLSFIPNFVLPLYGAPRAVIPVQSIEDELLPNGLFGKTAYLEVVDPTTGSLLHRIQLLTQENAETYLVDNIDAVVSSDETRAIVPVMSTSTAYLEIVDIVSGTLVSRIKLLNGNNEPTFLVNDVDVVLTPDGSKAIIPVQSRSPEVLPGGNTASTAYLEVVDIGTGNPITVQLLNQEGNETTLVLGGDVVLTPGGAKAVLPVESKAPELLPSGNNDKTAYLEIVDIPTATLEYRVRLLNQNNDPTVLFGDIDILVTPDGTKSLIPTQSASLEALPSGSGATAYLEIVDIGTGALSSRVQLLNLNNGPTQLKNGVDAVLVLPGGTQAIVPVQSQVSELLPSGNTDTTAYLEIVNISTGVLTSRVRLLTVSNDGTDLVRDVDSVITPDGARALIGVQGRSVETFPLATANTGYLEIINISTGTLESNVRLATTSNYPTKWVAGVDVILTSDGASAFAPVESVGEPFSYGVYLYYGTATLGIVTVATGSLTDMIPLLNHTGTITRLILDVDPILTPDDSRILVLVASDGLEQFPLGDCLGGCGTPYLQIIRFTPFQHNRIRLLNQNNTETIAINGIDPALVPDGTRALIPIQSQERVKIQPPGQPLPSFDRTAYLETVNLVALSSAFLEYRTKLLTTVNGDTGFVTGVDVTGHGSGTIGDVFDADADMAPEYFGTVTVTTTTPTTTTTLPDFGDAPDPFLGVAPPNVPAPGNYPSLLSHNGARHLDFSKEWLGDISLFPHCVLTPASADGESDAKVANLDNLDNGVRIIDQNGNIVVKLKKGGLYTVEILVSTSGQGPLRYGAASNQKLYLHGYFDWNRNGDWEEGMQFHESLNPAVPGWGNPNLDQGVGGSCALLKIPLNVPSNAELGNFYARFRLDYGEDVGIIANPVCIRNKGGPGGGLCEDVGEAQFGEVEDFPYEIIAGDTPDGPDGGKKSGYKWEDQNGNGVWDVGEPPLPGWEIILYKQGSPPVPFKITSTDHNGYYEFDGLPVGSYEVCERWEAFWIQTFPNGCYSFNISSPGEVHTDNNFGNQFDFPPLCTLTIYGWKWNDLNGNGIHESNEPFLPGWKIFAKGQDDLFGNPISDYEITDMNGFYQFDELPCGEYDIFEEVKPGWSQTFPSGGSYHHIVSTPSIFKDEDFGNKELIITTAIRLINLRVHPFGSGNLIEWTTGSEIDNSGFNILRGQSSHGPFERINPAIIPAKGISPAGATYTFVDSSVDNEETYYYHLEDIDTRGVRTVHNTVSATPLFASNTPVSSDSTSNISPQTSTSDLPGSNSGRTTTTSVDHGLEISGFGKSWEVEGQEGFIYQILVPDGSGLTVWRVGSEPMAELGNDERIASEVVLEIQGEEGLGFKAKGKERKVVLKWIARNMDDGYFLWRSKRGEKDSFIQITDYLLPSFDMEQSDKPLKFEYADTGVIPGVDYSYKLEAVDVLGKAQFVASASAKAIEGPSETEEEKSEDEKGTEKRETKPVEAEVKVGEGETKGRKFMDSR